jgi:tRNA(Ile2) C34 agmatinyltransferase TiaS
MTDPDPKETLRESREIFTDSYEAQHRLAARIGISHHTSIDVLADSGRPKARTIARLRVFLEAERAGAGIKPIELVQIKILKPTRYSLYSRLCPFCRKSHGKIQTAGRNKFQGVCPKCGASGSTRGANS